MKKILFIAAIVLCFLLPVFTFMVFGSDDVVVYVDGVGGEEGSNIYATLKDAVTALPTGGGTVVITAEVMNPTASGVELLANKPLVITSFYNNVDYRTTGAKLGIGRNIQLKSNVKFENIDLVNNFQDSNTHGNIYSQGYKLEIGEGVTCTPLGNGKYYPKIYGGTSGSTSSAKNNTIIISSGTWNTVFGGSYQKDSNTTTNITVNGGTITNLAGAGRGGATNATFDGTTNVTVTGGTITNLYGGTYGGNATAIVNGNSNVTVKGGTITNLYGANRQGAFTGNATVNVVGGTITNIYGGNAAGTFEGTSSVTVSDGQVYDIYGGSADGTFTGDTNVSVTGGNVTNYIVGANYLGTFEGNTKIDLTSGTVTTVCGGIYGVSGTATTFNGDIEILIHGNAVVNNNVFGTNRESNVSVTANVFIDVYENATLNRYLYGAGYYGNKTLGENGIVVKIRDNARLNKPSDNTLYVCAGSYSGTVTGDVSIEVSDNAYIQGNVFAAGVQNTLNGNSTATINGGEVLVTFGAGSRIGKVDGDVTVIANGGKIGYNGSTYYGIRASGGESSDTSYGSVTGSGTIVLDGADVAGAVTLGHTTDGSITINSGAFGSSPDGAIIDLSNGGTLNVRGELNATEIVGGGKIVLSSSAIVNATDLTGALDVIVESESPVHNQVCLTVANPDATGTVNYIGDDGRLEPVVDNGVTSYLLKLDGYYDTTTVTITYYNPNGTNKTQPKILVYKKIATSDENNKTEIAPQSSVVDGCNVATIDATPGLYYAKVYYNASTDYLIKYFYVSGKAEALTYDMPLELRVTNSYMEKAITHTTDEALEYLKISNLRNYSTPQTPTFTDEDILNRRAFLTNDEICDFVDSLGERSPYCYVYYPFELSAMGNRTPVMVFTKDEIPAGATLEETAAIVRGGGIREILLITGGTHGNEPAGTEGSLAYAVELCGEYGDTVLDKFGAIVIMPALSVDNMQRFTRSTAEGVNPNRTLISATLESNQNNIYVYTQFMPTLAIDCHEDYGKLVPDAEDFSMDMLEDVNIGCFTTVNTPITNPADYVGTMAKEDVLNQTHVQIMMNALSDIRDRTNLRSAVYYSQTTNPGTARSYYALRGSYSFLVEVMRIDTGKIRYERAVFATKEALVSLVDQFMSYNGELARNVFENRARMAANTKFDAANIFAMRMGGSGGTKVTSPSPSIYADGTYKNADRIKSYSLIDTVKSSRALPTAYVVDASDEHIEEILQVLDWQGISYTKIKAGSTLTLRKYTGGFMNTEIGEATEVTFENGAYAVTLNTSDAYLIAYLFEPDSVSASDEEDPPTISFAHQGYIADGDGLYRSEVDDVVDIIKSLEVDNSTVRGDADGDGYVTKDDAIYVLLNTFYGDMYPETQDFDFDGDGYVTKNDAIYVLLYTFYPDLYPIE